MQRIDQPIHRDIVLIGGGHSHVGVLRMFGMAPWAGVRLTLICTDIHTPYSGMLPGYIAGHYSHNDVHIDLDRLCLFAGARFFKDEVVGIDRTQQQVICKNGPPVPYDALSINIGSTPQVQLVPGALENSIPVKPIAKFNQRWVSLLKRVKTQTGKITIAVVGGGAGGVELVLAMQFRLRNELKEMQRNPDELEFHLFTAGTHILPTHNNAVRAQFEKALKARHVSLHVNAEVVQLSGHTLLTQQGLHLHADEIVWVTQAGGAAWLKNTGLELDKRGFLNVGPTLQTTRDPKIFAAGDIANLTNSPLEKAGVFAVRMGKPLTKNLHRFVQGKKLLEYHPQKTWLALISTGNKYAVASKGSLSFSGHWVWQWKDSIDRRFMARFSEFPDIAMR